MTISLRGGYKLSLAMLHAACAILHCGHV